MRSLFTIVLLLGGSLLGAYAQSVQVEKGYASTYPTAKENTLTESGEVYSSVELTACHATLPYGTLVRVTNIYNGKSVIVKINDHFSQKNYRLIDLSKAAAGAIDLFKTELPMVSLEVVGFEKPDHMMAANTAGAVSAAAISVPDPISSITHLKLPQISLEQINNAALKSIKFITFGLVK